MRTVLSLALLLLFGWFAADTLVSLLGRPLEGVYYPMASGRLKSMPNDWTQKAWFGAPMYLVIFAAIWLFFLRKEGPRKGLRLASLTSAFLMAPFWIVSLISADMLGLDLNGWWVASMVFANCVFLLYAFIGDGDPWQINF